MLFNSYEFVLLFLPITMWVFFRLGRQHGKLAIAFLVLASLFFYAWWNPSYLLLIVGSIFCNYSLGRFLLGTSTLGRISRKAILVFGIVANLSAIAYFKYLGFFLTNVNSVINADITVPSLILPLAISFFTFQQIAYLVDAYSGQTKSHSFIDYCLFVTFFPQLIAGPIVHQSEMLPQFSRKTFVPNTLDLSVGLSIFSIGLFKKVIIADNIALLATPVFSASAAGIEVSTFEAWTGALAYTFQLYFDFSGYSDMAIGLARMFSIQLPVNFDSPYKSASIQEFWRRWHMTLSRFLRDYLYIPLGGNRNGELRRNVNLLTTMLLGGLWHGAGWTFVIWGALHGSYLVVNQLWNKLCVQLNWSGRSTIVTRWMARLTTFLAVVVGWVFFRAADLNSAVSLLESMAGISNLSLPHSLADTGLGNWLSSFEVRFDGMFNNDILPDWADPKLCFPVLFALYLFVNFAPNSIELTSPINTSSILRWQQTRGWAVYTGILAGVGLLALGEVSEFLYFQF